MTYTVKPVGRAECAPFILERHYAKRWPSITYAFGLYRDSCLVGVVTYGTPPSAPLRRGIAGDIYIGNVLELNRLCLYDNLPNEASRLVGQSLKMLRGNWIVVSFADTEQGHTGKVYQACNFSYHGLSAKRTDWKVRGMEHLHGQTVADEFRGDPRPRAQCMREKYGDRFYLKDRPRKHRYIYVVGSRQFVKKARDSIRYPSAEYP